MKTVTYGWLTRKHPTPSLSYSSNKYQYYYCPEDEEHPFVGNYKMVKIKKAYVIHQNRQRFGIEDERLE